MDITAERRAHLQDSLTASIGEEATRTMMEHLPVGGAATLATKADLQAMADGLHARIDKCATKDDLKRFATKDDLQRFATTDHLAAELSRFATKDHLTAELSRFATKEDLAASVAGLVTKEEHRDLARTVDRIAVEVSEMRADIATSLTRSEGLQKQMETEAQVHREQIAMNAREQTAALESRAQLLRAEWKDDLTRYIGRQTLIQVGTLVSLIMASMAFVAFFVQAP